MSACRGRLGVLVRSFPKLSETFILSEVLGLERAGFDVTVFALRPVAEALVQPVAAQVRARVIPLSSALPGALGDLERALALAGHLRTLGIGHLHAHFVDGTADVAARAARIAGATLSHSAHAKDIYLSAPAALRRRLRRAAFTVTCTGYNRDVLARLAPDPARVHLVHHGIDALRFAPAEAQRDSAAGVLGTPTRAARVLAVGRLRPKKGFSTLVRACALLHERGVNVECDVVGYGDEQAALEAAIAHFGLSDRVRLLGRLNHERIVELYRAADVFAAPCEVAADGDRDGIPNVLLEAMAMALPVVTTPVSGIPEVVRDGSNGVLVPPTDALALADAIAGLAADPGRRVALGTTARRDVVAGFTEERSLRTLVGLLQPLVTAGTGAPVRGRPPHLDLVSGSHGNA